jgi:hypothetical protein
MFREQKAAFTFECLWTMFREKNFWDKVVSRGMLAHKNLIVAGDLNFTVSAGEVWGDTTHLDPLAGYFKDIFQENRLVDILPDEVVPTWRNGRSRCEGISKRLDRVYLSEDLLSNAGRHRSWVSYPYLSDHAHVLLQLENNYHTTTYPFKLNPMWLREDDFTLIVQEVWNDQLFLQESGAQRRLVWKLKLLKHE